MKAQKIQPNPTPQTSAGAVRPDTETELKFEIPPPARAAFERDIAARVRRKQRLVTRYFDTPDGQLARAGVALRLRQADRNWYQTLKASQGGSIHARHEHEVEIPAPAENEPPRPDLDRHDGTPAGQLLREALGDRPATALRERYATDFIRWAWDIVDGGTRVEAAFDHGKIIAGDRDIELCELELELKAGTPAKLAAIARPWVTGYGLWLNTESKAARGERLIGARTGLPVVKATTPQLDEAAGREAMLKAVVLNCLEQIVPNAAAVAAGSLDNAAVHQLRVGLRRLRTAMRELGDFSAGLDRTWETPVVEAFRKLGTFRDREAVLETLRPQLLKAGMTDLSWMDAAAEAADPADTVQAPAFQGTLVDCLGFALANGREEAAGEAQDMRRCLRRRIKSLHRRVVADGERFDKLSERAQHTVRKRLKRLRYLSEFLSGFFGGKAVDAYLEKLRPAQDALGEHNDYAVAGVLARSAANQGNAEAAQAAEWIARQQKHSAKESRRALRKLRAAPRYWKKKS